MRIFWVAAPAFLVLLLVVSHSEAMSAMTEEGFGMENIPNIETDFEDAFMAKNDNDTELVMMPKNGTDGELIIMPKQGSGVLTNEVNRQTTCKCGRKNPIVRIVGGVETTIHKYPWQVGLVASTSTRPFCGGSIISNQHILTAAHCVSGLTPSSFRVVVGEHNTITTSETTATRYFSVQSITVHASYSSTTLNNDIAIVKLSLPISFPSDNKVAPVCLPPSGNLYENIQAVAMGWGTTTEGGFISNVLREVTLPTLTNARCKVLYGATAITSNMLCAGLEAGGKDTCQGDSGGPLITSGGIKHQVIIGITSWGSGCARPRFPGVYTRVNNYLSWINANIAGSTTCPVP